MFLDVVVGKIAKSVVAPRRSPRAHELDALVLIVEADHDDGDGVAAEGDVLDSGIDGQQRGPRQVDRSAKAAERRNNFPPGVSPGVSPKVGNPGTYFSIM